MQVTEIYLGFASSRLYEKGGELHFDMSPAAGTQMGFPLRGPVADKIVEQNTDRDLVLSKGRLQYRFQFTPRKAGPDALKYSIRWFGFVPLGTYRGDISSDGKRVLRAAFGNLDI